MASTTPNGAPSPADFDLLPKLAPHLDRHMIFPLLEFGAGQLIDEETGDIIDKKKARENTEAKFALLKKTDMTDYVANLYCELKGLKEPPIEYAERKQKVFSQLEKFEQETGKITELLGREDVVSNFRSDKVANLEFLKKDHEVSIGMDIGRSLGETGMLTGGANRLRSIWSTLSTTTAISSTTAAATPMLPSSSTASVFCPQITIRFPTRPGVDLHARSST